MESFGVPGVWRIGGKGMDGNDYRTIFKFGYAENTLDYVVSEYLSVHHDAWLSSRLGVTLASDFTYENVSYKCIVEPGARHALHRRSHRSRECASDSDRFVDLSMPPNDSLEGVGLWNATQGTACEQTTDRFCDVYLMQRLPPPDLRGVGSGTTISSSR